MYSYENNTDTVTSRATLQINLSKVCSTINEARMGNKPGTLKILNIWVWIIF